jgi:hypothetical protein
MHMVSGIRGGAIVAKDVFLGGAAMLRAEPGVGEAAGAEEVRPITDATALVGVGGEGEGGGAGDAGEGDGGTRGHEGYLLCKTSN